MALLKMKEPEAALEAITEGLRHDPDNGTLRTGFEEGLCSHIVSGAKKY